MAISQTGTDTNNQLGGEYGVFLNFRGPDTRRNFADVLYRGLVEAGIHVFIDNEEIRLGEKISGNLLQAINDSRLYILIFSPKYASSHWCLSELATIMENTSNSVDENKKVILPIFYDVTPDDVKLKTELYENDILELEQKKQPSSDLKKFSKGDVESWRRALKEVDATMGCELEKYAGDGHLSNFVVEEVVKRLGIKRRQVTKDLVGMEDQIAAINNLLDIGSSDDSGGDFDSKHDVFLSFRGSDTRRRFTDTLYHALSEAGFHVFIDTEDLQSAERIDVDQVINDSRLYIPIFSRNYASSNRCLHELVKMVKNSHESREDENKKVILPIFYNVNPDDVRLRTPLYENAIMHLRKEFGPQELEAWQQALGEVGRIIGFDLQKYEGDGDLCNSVVKEVLKRLGREQRKADVRFIGIYGMTGIGKSTLAKIIFNQRYPQFKKYCSFLDDVSEMAKTKGLVKLQKQLLSNMSNSRVARNIEKIDHGTKMIGETICNKKVLIVLDDVDDVHQIQELIGMNSLGPGTRILVTTRDKRVLNIRGFKYEIVPYEMKGLSEEDTLQLFSRHAFDKNSPLADYDTLSIGIVSTIGGLPLALESIGSLLFLQKEKKIWEEKLEKLRKTPSRFVLGKLRISYDALETDQQQIFLDVACFFIGENKTNPIYMWRDCGFSPEDSIDVLVSRCMITVTDDNKFWMHNQFRDLGRAIATQESSRLWATDDIICELKSTEIKRSVQALCLQSDLSTQPTLTATPEQIERFPHLRFLRFSLGTCQGNFTGCLSKLKWISVLYPDIQPSLQGQCHPRLEATNWHLENVVVANLSGPGFTDDEWLLSGASKLKVLTLQGTGLQTLERLLSNLTNSRTREKVESLERLVQLEKLTVEGCELLKRLSIPSSLSKLREVKVSSCTELVEVQFLGVLSSMEILCIEDCKSLMGLKNLEKLENLKDLGIKGCKNLLVVEGIDELKFLQWLTVKGCGSMESIIGASCSKIPKKCEISITDCGKLPDTG